MNEENIENGGLSLKDIFLMLRAHLIGIIVCFIVGAGCGLGVGYNVPTKYQASEKVYVLDSSSGDVSTEVVNGLRLVETFSDFVTDSAVLIETVNRINKLSFEDENKQLKLENIIKNISYTEISKNLSFSSTDKTTLCVTVYYTHTDLFTSKVIIENVIEAAKYVADNTQSLNIFKNRIQTTFSDLGNGERADVKIVSKGKAFYTVIFALIGLIVGIAYALLRELFDNTIKDKSDLENRYNVKVIGTIPEFVEENKHEKK